MRTVSLLLALMVFSIMHAKTDPEVPELKEGSISGKVIDQSLHAPVAYATVVVKSLNDSTNITGGITSEDGSFKIEKLPDGEFIVEVQYIGYKTHSQQITLDKGHRNARIGDHHHFRRGRSTL